MAFKSKINVGELTSMDFKSYANLLKKEVAQAAKFGETSVVAFSHFKFACGYEGTLLLLGKFSGELAKYYKKAKIERKQEKDFARGVCYFETNDKGEIQMHIALSDGKGKPDKLQKNGKALFKKLGITPQIVKGDLELGMTESLHEEELTTIEDAASEENDTLSMTKIHTTYKKLLQQVNTLLVPILKEKQFDLLKRPHFELAKKALAASYSFLDKYEELEGKEQEKFAQHQEIVSGKHEQLQKIAAKVKKELTQKAQVHGSNENVTGVLKDVQVAMDEMRQQFKDAFALIEEMKIA